MANEVEVALLLQQVARTRRVAAQYLGPDEDEDIAELQGGALEELQREFRCGGVKCVRCQVSNVRCQVSGVRSQVSVWLFSYYLVQQCKICRYNGDEVHTECQTL